MSRTPALLAALCALSLFGADAAAQSYTFVPVNPHAGVSSVNAGKLNVHADIVGASSGNMTSYTWVDGITQPFGVSQAILRDINDSGVVTGYRQQGNYQYAFRHDLNTGVTTNLHSSTNCSYTRSVDPVAIANTGKIVGTRVATDCRLEAFQTSVLGVHGMSFLDTTRADRYSMADDISDNGAWIVGSSRNTSGQDQAFRRGNNGVMEGLQQSGASITRARAVNDSGVVAGIAQIGGVFLPVRWISALTRQALGLPAGMIAGYPSAINNSGVIVGTTQGQFGLGRATAWNTSNQPHYVQDTKNNSDAGWVAWQAQDINAAGYITVSAHATNDTNIRKEFLAIPDGSNPVDCVVNNVCMPSISPDACALLGGVYGIQYTCELPSDPGGPGLE